MNGMRRASDHIDGADAWKTLAEILPAGVFLWLHGPVFFDKIKAH